MALAKYLEDNIELWMSRQEHSLCIADEDLIPVYSKFSEFSEDDDDNERELVLCNMRGKLECRRDVLEVINNDTISYPVRLVVEKLLSDVNASYKKVNKIIKENKIPLKTISPPNILLIKREVIKVLIYQMILMVNHAEEITNDEWVGLLDDGKHLIYWYTSEKGVLGHLPHKCLNKHDSYGVLKKMDILECECRYCKESTIAGLRYCINCGEDMR